MHVLGSGVIAQRIPKFGTRVSGLLYVPNASPSRKEPRYYRIGGWVGLRTGLVVVVKREILPCRGSNLGCPGRSLVTIGALIERPGVAFLLHGPFSSLLLLPVS
jgi:hypothetical protein